jgi:hypothetical protein
MGGVLCFVSITSCVAKNVAKSTLGDLFDALTAWVLSSVEWFINGVGGVLLSASEPATVVRSATPEFQTLIKIAPILLLVGLLVGTLESLRHGESSTLWRLYLGVAPACVLAIYIALPAAKLFLEAVDQVSISAAGPVEKHLSILIGAFSGANTGVPGLGIFILSTTVVIGAFFLWCELIVRTVSLSLLLVLVPIVVPLCTFPALRKLGWRLFETFAAIAVSKVLIVIALTLGLGELQGNSVSQIITGAVTLILATFTPFVLLRLIPFIEQSALHSLQGTRQHFMQGGKFTMQPVQAVRQMMEPNVESPGPPLRREDLGFPMSHSTGNFSMPAPRDFDLEQEKLRNDE